jgi:hypothetical protein
MTMNDFLTRAEIDKKFDSEWVLLENPKMDRHHRIKGGIVLSHSKNRDDVYRKLVETKPKYFAVHYTGEIPEGTVIIL